MHVGNLLELVGMATLHAASCINVSHLTETHAGQEWLCTSIKVGFESAYNLSCLWFAHTV